MKKPEKDGLVSDLLGKMLEQSEPAPIQEVKPVKKKTRLRKARKQNRKPKQQTKVIVTESKVGRKSPFPEGTVIMKGSYQLSKGAVDAMRKAVFKGEYISQNHLIDTAIRALLDMEQFE